MPGSPVSTDPPPLLTTIETTRRLRIVSWFLTITRKLMHRSHAEPLVAVLPSPSATKAATVQPDPTASDPSQTLYTRSAPIPMKKRIAVINQKGGVGKTTTTVNLAGAFAQLGLKVLALDVDCQGDLSSIFLENHETLPYTIADLFGDTGILARDLIQPTLFPNIWVIPADRRLNAVDKTHDFLNQPNLTCITDAINEVEKDFDVVLMDCAPRSHLSAFAALVAADHLLIPVEVENFAVRSLASIEEDYHTVKQLFNPRTTIHYFLSKVGTNSKTQERSRQILTQALGDQNVFKTSIPMMATYKSAINVRRPIVFHKPKTKAAQIVRDFATELLGVSHDHADQAAA